MASIEKRSGNTYRLTVSCGYDLAGRKVRRSKTITLPDDMTPRQTERELSRLAVLFEEEIENGTYLNGSAVTFAEFTQKWLGLYAEKRLAPGTLNPYKSRLEKRIIPELGHIKLSKLQPHHLMEFYNNLAEPDIRLDGLVVPTAALVKKLSECKTYDLADACGVTFKTCQRIKSGSPTTRKTAEKLCITLKLDVNKMFKCSGTDRLSDKTIRGHHGIISAILSAAVKWGVISTNPAARVDLGKSAKYKPSYYEETQLDAMFAALEGEPLRYSAMIYLTIDTGMRSGEITGLVWSDMDLERGTVTVSKQRQYVSGYGTIEKPPKTENGIRTITLSETVAAIMKQHRNAQMHELMRIGEPWDESRNVFLHEDGTAIHPHRPYKWFTDFLSRHNLPKITFHQLRHTNASLLIAEGVDIVTLSGRLGHGDRNITLNTYSHIIKSREAEAANRMNRLYGKSAKNKREISQ